MIYKLQRYEQKRDKDGIIVAIFVALDITDATNEHWCHEYWLNNIEIADVLKNETKLVTILEKQCAIGEKNFANFNLNKPQPDIIASDAKRSSFTINPVAVATFKTTL